MKAPAPLDAVVARLLALHPKRIDLTLDRMWRILERLDHPERRLPAVIHVGGTNGKGSTIAFLRAILEAAGLAVHVYTSPNLVRVNERIRLGRSGGGVLVSDEELASGLMECERANGDEPITLFEMETAAALMLFARHPADVLLLEVGLGGRLDATNVVERPLATVISPVSVDHVEFLGGGLAEIAAEKAGILKPGVPAIVARQESVVLDVIEGQARRLSAPLHVGGENWLAMQERGRLVFQDEHGLLDLPLPKLFGRHQIDNAGLAIATLRALPELSIPPRAYEAGMVRAEWPARMQRLSQGRLLALIPEGGELWLDGGHNPDGARAIAAALADLEERVSRPLVLVLGMLATKDCESFLRHFTGLARRILAVPIPDQEKSLPPEVVAEAARELSIPATSHESLEDALAFIGRFNLAPPPRVLITGSLYLAGAVLAANGTPPA